MKASLHLSTCVILLCFLTACGNSEEKPDSGGIDEADRPPRWAQPIAGLEGLPNFHKVSDPLYRGAQPEDEGFAELKRLGIKTVVNLRSLHSDRSECEKAGLDYVKITAQAWEAEEDEVVDFLKILADRARHPVFVHCQHGADRTGMMVAIYRIAMQDWSKEEAIREMRSGGFGYHSIWKGLIEYVDALDVDALKKQVESG